MTNSVTTFNFSTQQLRAVLIDGAPWFIAIDVCEVLAHSDTSKAVSRLDDDEKLTRTMFASGQNRELLFINESGLYSLILTSRKPEAKKFKKWVTSEVLPAIRKTGRYEAPAAQPEPPAHTAERLSNNDLRNIKRLVWIIANGFRFESAWCAGIWFYLRRALCVPAPQQYSMEHLPRIAQELQTLAAASERVHMMMIAIEKEAATRIFRRGEVADAVVADLQAKALQRLETLQTQCAQLPSYLRTDMTAVTARAPNHYDHASATEVPGYFDKQGAAA